MQERREAQKKNVSSFLFKKRVCTWYKYEAKVKGKRRERSEISHQPVQLSRSDAFLFPKWLNAFPLSVIYELDLSSPTLAAKSPSMLPAGL